MCQMIDTVLEGNWDRNMAGHTYQPDTTVFQRLCSDSRSPLKWCSANDFNHFIVL